MPSMVVEEGGEARTIKFCQQCHNAKLMQQGQTATEVMAMERSRGQEGASWKDLNCTGKLTISVRNVGVFYS